MYLSKKVKNTDKKEYQRYSSIWHCCKSDLRFRIIQ